MKKKIIVAVATVLVLANGASVAFADSGSGSTKKSTTSASGSENARLKDAEKAASKAEREAYLTNLKLIRTTFKTALGDAENSFRTNIVLAAPEARASVQTTFRAAVTTAFSTYRTSLSNLGPRPVKPGHSDEQKDARKVAKAAFKVARVGILVVFHAEMEIAREAFKFAKEAATTDELKKAAESAFKTAVSTLTEAKTAALKALVKP